MDQHTRNLVTAALVHDQDTYKLHTPRGVLTLTLRVEHDPETSVSDFDCYGLFQPVARDPHAPRPFGFDGAARKLWADRSTQVWWQPPADVLAMPDSLRLLAATVRDLLEFGFYSVGVTVHETLTDRLGHDHDVETGAAWLGGVDGVDDAGYLADIVVGLLDELEGEGVLP